MDWEPWVKARQHKSLVLIASAAVFLVLFLWLAAPGVGPRTVVLLRSSSSAAQSCKRRVGDQPLRWLADRSLCEPDVCNGARLSDIPGFQDGVPAQLACSLPRGPFDMWKARRCLAGKRLLMLGDSTFVEQTHDLVMLLGGLGGDQAAVNDYCLRGTKQPFHGTQHMRVGSSRASSLDITFSNAHYNMSVASAEDNIHISSRFLGYWSPAGVEAHRPLFETPDAVFGVKAFAEPRFQKELSCLLGEDPACPAPDIVLANSGFWDQVHFQNTGDSSRYEPLAMAFGRRLAALPGKAYWVGSRACHAGHAQFLDTMGFDAVAAAALPAVGVPFINLAPTMRLFMPDPDDIAALQRYSGDGLHYGAISRYQGYSNSLAVTSAILQTVLNAIC